MVNRKYSEDDEIYLEYYLYDGEEKNYDLAAEFLGADNEKLVKKANKMRQRNKDVGYINKPFTEREVEYIKRNYEMISTEIISEHLGRSRDVIIWKANKLGLRKLKRIEGFDAEIRRLAGEGYWKAEIARILGLKPKSVGDYMNRNQIDCGQAPKEVSQKHFRNDEALRHHHVKDKTYLK